MVEGNYNPFANDIYDVGIICLEMLLGEEKLLKL